MSSLGEDINKVISKVLLQIKGLSDDQLKAFLAGEGQIRYVSPLHEVKLKPVPKPPAPLPVPTHEVMRHLNSAGSPADATAYLTGLKFKQAELKRLAAELDVPLTGTAVKVMIADIVKVKVAGRVTTEVVQRF
jgi:hypothetical protein